MPKFDPYTLPRPKRAGETKVWDLDGPEFPLSLTLRPAGFADAAAAEEEAKALIETYLTGSEFRGAAPFPDPEVRPSETLFRVVTLLRVMQCGDPADAYNTMELIQIAHRQPKNWAAVMGWFGGLAGGLTETLGNSPGSLPA